MSLGCKRGTRPFIGSGLGVTADIAKTNIGLYSFQKTGWHFTVRTRNGYKNTFGLWFYNIQSEIHLQS